jgi:thiamine pyrophosphokinase
MNIGMRKNKKTIAIVAGGTLHESVVSRVRKAGYIIGVDKGAYWLLKHGIVPDVAIGDFDSVSTSELRVIEKKVKNFIRHPAVKDATDLELAIEHAKTLAPKEVGIFGAIGTRYDHTYAGIMLLTRLASHNIYGYIVDNFNEIFIVRRVAKLTSSGVFPYISLFPLQQTAVVTLKGFRYNVTRQAFVPGSTLGVSNEIVGKNAQVMVHQGAILLIRSRD